jgi:catechol 2,3-dioxygenase-like lactoylglutathione lyase family enzyme
MPRACTTHGRGGKSGLVVAAYLVSSAIRARRSAARELSFVALANSWIIINVGGGPTDDKPTVTLETPPDPDRVSSFLNIRVADIQAVYDDWSARGAEFLTPPQDRGAETRCYVRDPDGHLIEVGQTSQAYLEEMTG